MNAVGRSVSVDLVDHRGRRIDAVHGADSNVPGARAHGHGHGDLGQYRLRKPSAPSCSDSTSTLLEGDDLSVGGSSRRRDGHHGPHHHHHHHHRLHSRHSHSETLTMTVPAADNDDDTSSWVSGGVDCGSIGDLGDLDSKYSGGPRPADNMFIAPPDLDNSDNGRSRTHSTEYDSTTSSMCSELESHFRNEVDGG